MPPERAFGRIFKNRIAWFSARAIPTKWGYSTTTEFFFARWRPSVARDRRQRAVAGFAVAVHPRDGNTAWFVPAVKDETRVPVDGRLVVTCTRDGGATLEPLQQSFPQQSAFHLIYRHGLDISADGAELAMGSTTGGLWWSGDQGDRWELVSAHLPPIYAVRFAAA